MLKFLPDRLADKVVLVTGASGFIGSHLCCSLTNLGAEVHATSRTERKSPDLQWWQINLSDVTSVRKLFADIHPQIIYHLSGHVTAAPHLPLVLSTFESHVASTVNVLTLAAERGCERLVMTGSLTEPQFSGPEPVPSSPYAAAKWASVAYGRMFQTLYKTPVVTVRPFMTYGPKQNPDKLIPYVILSSAHGRIPKLTSGEWKADWIYIDDVIRGMLAATQVGGFCGRTIDLGSGVTVPIRSVVERLLTLMGSSVRPAFGAMTDRPSEEIRAADIDYTCEILGWRPAIALDDGLSRTIDWYRQQVCSQENLFSGREARL
jgi:UDP-glucose 4-epimerase